MAEAHTQLDQTIITHESQQSLLENTSALDTLSDVVRDLGLGIDKIVHMLVQQFEQDDFPETIQLNAGLEWTLDKHGRRFALVFSPVALANIGIIVMGVKGTITIPAGWSCLNEPDRAVYTPPAGMNQLILVKYSNWWSGSTA